MSSTLFPGGSVMVYTSVGKLSLNLVPGVITILGIGLLFSHVALGQEVAESISFKHQVVPVLTKAGCNAGACHAKAGGGQNGFQLSLLGYEPAEDYEALVKGARGRRVFPAAAEKSLLLMKATGQLPHGGGARLDLGSPEYALIKSWIEAGMPENSVNEAELLSIEVVPPRATLTPGANQALSVLASFSDGTRRDVTSTALFESNDSNMATVTPEGRVDILDVPGKVAIMVRFEDKVDVFSALVPLGDTGGPMPEPNNFIDELVFASLDEIGIPVSTVCDDATFLRRVTLDIAGRLPTLEEAEAFLASESSTKRQEHIENLLQSGDYADYFANKWTTLLKNRRDDASDITSNFAFHFWVRDSLLANKPYDQWVRELLAATGTVIENPAVAWYKRVKEPKEQIEDVAQLFLGVRMQCAQCHHHPFERWSQDDYYGLVAFFSQVGRKPTGIRGEDQIFHQRGTAEAKNVRSGVMIRPAALGDEVGLITPDTDPRLKLADWMANPENPFFAKALVNRYWKHFFKRGLIEPEDDIRDSNPPTNPELLAALEKHFVESGFDLKELVRVIVESKAYQLSAVPEPLNQNDSQNYSHYYPKRLQAEVLLDSIDQLTGVPTTFANLPAGTRAIALPDNSYNRASQLLVVFGRPENTSVCECERVQGSSLAQSLHMLNSNEIKGKVTHGTGIASVLSQAMSSDEDKIRELYLRAYAREPSADEMTFAKAYLTEPVDGDDGKPLSEAAARKRNLEDFVWALMNTKEFLFNH
jgi:hypothetical protein